MTNNGGKEGAFLDGGNKQKLTPDESQNLVTVNSSALATLNSQMPDKLAAASGLLNELFD